MPYIIGLTGGIGSGKSTVADAFAQQGVPVFSADAIGHQLSASGQPGFMKIVQTFGDTVIGEDGELDRAALGDLIFREKKLKQKLEDILHPMILESMHQQANTVTAPYCILDIPLLVGTEQINQIDRLLVVDCHRQTRIERIRNRSGWSDGKIALVMENQVSDQELKDAADDIVDNNGDIDAIIPQVNSLHRKYLKLAEHEART